jgi:hypothetical protein
MAQSIWTGFSEWENAGGGATEVVALNMPHRGVIQSIEVVRRDGQIAPSSDFSTLSLYTSSDTNDNRNLLVDLLSEWATKDELNLAYLNTDGSPALPQRKLYLKTAGTEIGGHVIRITIRLFV